MRRTRTTILMLLLIGMIVNIAVAWACALWWPVPVNFRIWFPEAMPEDLAGRAEIRAWAKSSGPPSIGVALSRVQSAGFGVRLDSLGVEELVPGDDGSMGPSRVHRAHSAGWPFYSMACEGYLDWSMEPKFRFQTPPDWRGGIAVPFWMRPSTSGPEVLFFPVPRPLPLRVVPLGFVADSVLYGVIAGCVLFVPGAVRGAWRARRRLCRACGYPVSGLAICPECGRAVESASGQGPVPPSSG